MVFSSPLFLFLFLPLVLSLYFLGPRWLRNPLLLLASLFFYAWGEQKYVVILLASIAGNYILGLWLDRARRPGMARLLITAAVMLNLGLLGTFKYANFLVDNWNAVLGQVHFAPLKLDKVHLPLGISFFTFHALSYVLDVYRREVRALKNPVTFALYISYFPQSIAGPIVRYGDIAGQLPRRAVTLDGFADGVKRFILGLAKKMLIANTLAGPADGIFSLPGGLLTGGLAWLGVVCYTLQIYFDFSGYSDMAIGLAKMFGFQFKENFSHPYVARSITEFWRRWHISLSTWYRDYLYIPLGGNRCSTGRVYLNLATVFFLCGLWHGASWTFIVWGLYHGLFLVLERMGVGKRLEAAWAPVGHVYALLVVMVGWVFFRATTLAQAAGFLGAIAGFGRGAGTLYYPALYLSKDVVLVLLAAVVCSMPLVPLLARLRDGLLASRAAIGRLGPALQTALALAPVAALALLLLASVMLLAGGTYNPFIYFRF